MVLGKIIENIVSDNGLQVLYVEDSSVPLFTIQAWVHAGSFNDPDGSAGCAHMIEHLVFNGTIDNPAPAVGLIDSVGGTWSAFTMREFTVFSVTVPAEYSIKALNILLDMIYNPLLDINRFKHEKTIVANEAAQNESSIQWINLNNMWKSISPYGLYDRPITGTVEDIQSMSYADITEYHSTYYAPSNVMLVMVGSLPLSDIINTVDSFRIKRNFLDGPKARHNTIPTSPRVKNNIAVRYRKGLAAPHVLAGLITQPAVPEQYFNMKAVEHIFYLNNQFFVKKNNSLPLLTGNNSEWQLMKNFSVFTISSYLNPDEIKLLEKKADNLFDISTDLVGQYDIKMVKSMVEKDYLMKNYRQRDCAYTVGLFDFLDCNNLFLSYRQYLDRIDQDSIKNYINNMINGCLASIILPEEITYD